MSLADFWSKQQGLLTSPFEDARKLQEGMVYCFANCRVGRLVADFIPARTLEETALMLSKDLSAVLVEGTTNPITMGFPGKAMQMARAMIFVNVRCLEKASSQSEEKNVWYNKRYEM